MKTKKKRHLELGNRSNLTENQSSSFFLLESQLISHEIDGLLSNESLSWEMISDPSTAFEQTFT